MVFVWSHLTDGDPAYTLVQVSVNDLIMLVLFVPIVQFLVTGASSLTVPFGVLLYSVIVFIVIPLTAGTILRALLIRQRGQDWFEKELLPRFAPVTITALLATLVFIFAFQADNITNRSFHVLLIAVPITLQVYLNSSLAYGLMRLLKVEHSIAAPGALIGASNFFELAVATAIALFGPESGAALATVVGVLVEVPVVPRPADRRTDHVAGLPELIASLRADEIVESRAFHRRPWRLDRSQQFLRTRGRDGDRSVRPGVRSRAGDRRWRAGRSAGHALRLPACNRTKDWFPYKEARIDPVHR